MDRDKEERLQRELLDGETVEWSGEPRPGAVFSSRDMLLIPFAICLCCLGVAIGLPSLVFRDNAMVLTGLLFIIPGLFLLIFRYIIKYYQNKNTTYAVTNQRVIIIHKRNVCHFTFNDIPTLDKKEKRNGRGSLSFERSRLNWTRSSTGDMRARGFGYKNFLTVLKLSFVDLNPTALKEFKGVERIDDVYQLIQHKAQAAKEHLYDS